MVVYDLSKTRGDTGKPVGSGDRGSFEYTGRFNLASTTSSSGRQGGRGVRGGGRGNSHPAGESEVDVTVSWDTTNKAYNKFTHRPKGRTQDVQGARIVFKSKLINVGKYDPTDKLSSVDVYFLKSKKCGSGYDRDSDTGYPFLVVFNESGTRSVSRTGDKKVYYGNPGKSGDSEELGNWSKWEELKKGTSRTVEKSLIEKLSLIEKKCGTLGENQKARRVRVYKILKGDDLEEEKKVVPKAEEVPPAVTDGTPETEVPEVKRKEELDVIGEVMPVPEEVEVIEEVVTLPVTVPVPAPVPVTVPGPVLEVTAMPEVPSIPGGPPETEAPGPKGATGEPVPVNVLVPVPDMPDVPVPAVTEAVPAVQVTVPAMPVPGVLVPVPHPRGSLDGPSLKGDKGEAGLAGDQGEAGHPSITIEGSLITETVNSDVHYLGGGGSLLAETSDETSKQYPVLEVKEEVPAVPVPVTEAGPRGFLGGAVPIGISGSQGEAGLAGDKGEAGHPSITIEGPVIDVNSFSGETSLIAANTSLVENSEHNPGQIPVLKVTEAVPVPVLEVREEVPVPVLEVTEDVPEVLVPMAAPDVTEAKEEVPEEMPVPMAMISGSRETNMPGLESWLMPVVELVSFLGKGAQSLLKGSGSTASTTSSTGSDTDYSSPPTAESPVDGGGNDANPDVNDLPHPIAPAITSDTAYGSDSRGDTISSPNSSSTFPIGGPEAGSSSNGAGSQPAAPGSCRAPGGRFRRAAEYGSASNCGPGSGHPSSPGSDGKTPNESQTPVIIGSAVGVTVALAAVSTGGYLWHSLGTMTVRDMMAYF